MSLREQMNIWGEAGIPFLFLIDFENNKPLIFPLDEIDNSRILFDFNGFTNCPAKTLLPEHIALVRHPEAYEDYLFKFKRVQAEIGIGNSYLLNLTCSTPIELNLTLKEVFLMCNSRYRIWIEDKFVCFSPEIFVTIRDGIISSYPMKGTIDAAIKDAEKIILFDFKEKAEHNTIVDLIRNDLSLVSTRVRVERFRYTETIKTNGKWLLQVSSEICGDLEENYLSHLGDIILYLLPAGSVSGAPKRKTEEIISEVEGCERGYYTGVAGIFDGQNLDSCVLIRFIEKSDAGYIYRSGGGITSFSDPVSEYREMIDKIYVPII
jgi:para-aminobenzoate synthetase component I